MTGVAGETSADDEMVVTEFVIVDVYGMVSVSVTRDVDSVDWLVDGVGEKNPGLLEKNTGLDTADEGNEPVPVVDPVPSDEVEIPPVLLSVGRKTLYEGPDPVPVGPTTAELVLYGA